MSRAVAVILAFGLGCGDDGERLRVVGGDGMVMLEVAIERAVSEDERRTGLRGKTLERDEGLLIVLPGTSDVCIVNDGVTLDLDLVYFDAELLVTAIEAAIAAGDPTPRCHPAAYVLEVNAGTAAAVRPGQLGELD